MTAQSSSNKSSLKKGSGKNGTATDTNKQKVTQQGNARA
jgi:hypothetical protein